MAFPFLALAQFGVGALQSVGQYQQSQADYNYGVAQTTQDYYNRVQQSQFQERERALAWQERLSIRRWKTAQFHEQVEENFNALEESWFNNNKLANEYIEKFAGQAFRQEIAFQEAQSASYNEQAGKRSNLRQGVNEIRKGMERVNMVDQLTLNLDKIEQQKLLDARKTKMDNKNMWYGISQPLTPPARGPAPMAPVYQSAPSSMGLYSGLLGSAVSAYSTYGSLKPGGNNITPGKTG